MKEILRTEIIGNRAGNAIRFTCPDCHRQNEIVYNMPKDFFKETRDASCTGCRKRYTVLTPDHVQRKPVVSAAPSLR